MTPYERLADVVAQLVDGWDERVEYAVTVQQHFNVCREVRSQLTEAEARHYRCKCPETVEQRAENRRQQPLVEQLAAAAYEAPTRSSDTNTGGSSNSKPSSRMPGNLQQPDEILSQVFNVAFYHADEWAIVDPSIDQGDRDTMTARWLRALRAAAPDVVELDHVNALVRDLRPLVRRARVLLGYERDQQQFADMLCECGGALAVDRSIDSGTVVRCAGTPDTRPCKTTYPWWQWADMLKSSG